MVCSQSDVCLGKIGSPDACLACNNTCEVTEACGQGGCSCRAGLKTCPNQGCVDTQFDHNNCGNCGDPCADGEFCNAGNCRTEQECINSGAEPCDNGTCLTAGQRQRDPLNCGMCGNVCAHDEACVNGNCVRYFLLLTCDTAVCGTDHTCCPASVGKVCYEGQFTCPG